MMKWLIILLFPFSAFSQKVIYQSTVFALPDSLLSKIGCGFLTGDLVDNTDPCHPIVGLTGTHTLTGTSTIFLNDFITIGAGGLNFQMSVPDGSVTSYTPLGKSFQVSDDGDVAL